MSDVINLRMARKARARTAAQKQAEANRARHGQPLVVTRLVRAEAERASRQLDQARREPETDEAAGKD